MRSRPRWSSTRRSYSDAGMTSTSPSQTQRGNGFPLARVAPSPSGLTRLRARSTIGLVLPVWSGTIGRAWRVQGRRACQALLVLCLLLPSCATGPASSDRPAAPPPLAREDLRWLNRVTFGVDAATVARYRQLGRARFLDEQLKPPDTD